jgi:isopentenyl diphosphate isomerase/L-lactate dehydrogenase-like FMN-dependent dehydrogenase
VRAQLSADARRLVRRPARDGLDRYGSIAELRERARRGVPRPLFDFADGAAQDEVTARANVEDLAALRILPRPLVDVGEIDVSTSVFGRPIAMPLVGAPTGLTALIHHHGEPAVARACAQAGTVYVASTMASYAIEEIRAATDGPLWFQLYVMRDRGIARELLRRARESRCEALVLTVDTPRLGSRERDRRNGFTIPPRLTARALLEGLRRPAWARDFMREGRLGPGNLAGDAVAGVAEFALQIDPTLSWRDLAWVREQWDGPLVVKGILHPGDARRAVEVGAQAIAVSNHGGRQLDGAASSISALPGVLDAVAGDAEVYFDGGVRRGADVLKALALGAQACLTGRGLLYGLAVGGEAGAARALAILRGELELALALAGCPAVGRLDASWLVDRHQERAGRHGPQDQCREAAGVEADDEERNREGEQEQRSHGRS